MLELTNKDFKVTGASQVAQTVKTLPEVLGSLCQRSCQKYKASVLNISGVKGHSYSFLPTFT